MTWRLNFDGLVTFIATPFVPKTGTPTTIEIMATTPTLQDRALFGTQPVDNFRNTMRVTTGNLRVRLFGTNTELSTLIMPVNVPTRVALFWSSGGGTRGELGADTQVANLGVGANDEPLLIGRDAIVSRWAGSIWDVKVYDGDFGLLLHHWPIDDNAMDGGTIRDVVGGLDGTLTLGAGSWSWVPMHFGITRPIMREVLRPVMRLGVAGPGI